MAFRVRAKVGKGTYVNFSSRGISTTTTVDATQFAGCCGPLAIIVLVLFVTGAIYNKCKRDQAPVVVPNTVGGQSLAPREVAAPVKKKKKKGKGVKVAPVVRDTVTIK